MSEPIDIDVFSTLPTKDVSESGALVSRPVSESITETMDRAPQGSVNDIVYAVLGRRLRTLLDPDSPVGDLLGKAIIPQAVNFRALNAGTVPRTPPAPNAGTSSGKYHGRVFGTQPDERMPTTLPLPTGSLPYAIGQDPGLAANAGVLIARVFADLQSHIPCVLFNMTAKTPKPMNIGGQALTRKFRHKGKTVSELGYYATISVEATVVTNDETATGNLQAIVEAAYWTLRDHVGTGAVIGGKQWQMTMPVRVSPSTISEVDAPWSGGDDKGGKLYVATVGLEDMSFECYSYVERRTDAIISSAGAFADTLSVALQGEDDTAGPLRVPLGSRSKVIITGMELSHHVVVDQTKKVVDLSFVNGHYVLTARRKGTAKIRVYDAGMTVALGASAQPAGRVSAPLYTREVVVSAV